VRPDATRPTKLSHRSAAFQAILGLVLVLVSWRISWSGPEPFRFHTFFPLWLGYILIVDALSLRISGSSLLRRAGWKSIGFFGISAPFWWIFEAANAALGNWVYELPRDYSWLEYRVEATVAFSTVVPAVFVTSELVRLGAVRGPVRWVTVAPSKNQLILISASGAAMTVLALLLPDLLFPFIWVGIFLLIDPVSHLLGGKSISGQVRHGRWDTVIVLFAATLICGFFWEMWNSRAMPKWRYELPYSEWWRLFEMPAFGYGGYLPFSLELFAIFAICDRLLRLGLGDSIRFDREAG
jgi:hypothetical protein